MPRATILCVDDRPQFLSTLASVLRRANYAAITASDNVEAFERLKDPSRSIDAAVIDIVLADRDLRNRDGVLLARALKSRIPVVILSGYIEDSADLERAGVACWISKHDSEWEPKLLGWLSHLTHPAVYVSHEGSPRAREISHAIQSLGLRVLPDLAEGDGDWDVIRKPALVNRFAFAVVLLPAEGAGADRERAIRKWGYLQGALGPENVLALCEGLSGGEGTADQECLRFDREGGWKSVLEQRFQAANLIGSSPKAPFVEHPRE